MQASIVEQTSQTSTMEPTSIGRHFSLTPYTGELMQHSGLGPVVARLGKYVVRVEFFQAPHVCILMMHTCCG